MIIGLFMGAKTMFRREKDEDLRMWAIFFLIGAIVMWLWVMREQSTAEEAAQDALDAAEGIKKKVEIKTAPEASEPKTEPTPIPKPEVKASTPPAPTEPRPRAAIKAEPDDLTRIEGIGPKFAEILIAAGIDSYAKLAAMSEEAITETIRQGGGRKSASIGTWAEQARLAAAGDWDGLATLQANLSGGRRQ
jgi:predicted flap endonuclease-1-like 5' DNA nuclease